MNIRQVRLCEGPLDGGASVASHCTAICVGEVYVWDGGEDENRFVHAKTALAKLPAEQQEYERALVLEWLMDPGTPSGIRGADGNELMLPAPSSMCVGIPPWRVNAWGQLLKMEL